MRVEVTGGGDDSLWEDEDSTYIKPKGDKKVKAEYIDSIPTTAEEIDTNETGKTVQDKLDEIELGIGLFEIDINGGLMPITETLPDK